MVCAHQKKKKLYSHRFITLILLAGCVLCHSCELKHCVILSSIFRYNWTVKPDVSVSSLLIGLHDNVPCEFSVRVEFWRHDWGVYHLFNQGNLYRTRYPVRHEIIWWWNCWINSTLKINLKFFKWDHFFKRKLENTKLWVKVKKRLTKTTWQYVAKVNVGISFLF